MRSKSSATLITPMQAAVFAIVHQMTPEYKSEVVGRALKMRDKVSVHARGLLNAALREDSGKLRISGFERDASKVPAPKLHLLTAPISRSLHSGKMPEAILRVWEETYKELQEETREFLEARQLPVRSSILSNDMEGEWEAEEMTALVEQFAESHAAYHLDDIRLMLCCVCGRMPMLPDGVIEKAAPPSSRHIEDSGVPETETQATDTVVNGTIDRNAGVEQNRREDNLARLDSVPLVGMENAEQESSRVDWSELLVGWQALAPDAAQWEHIEEFIGHLRLLAKSKYEQHNAGRRTLRQALDKLRAENADTLTDFGIPATQWSEQVCAAASASALAEDVLELHNLLQDYAHLPAPNSRRAQQFQEQLKADIEEMEARLSQSLTLPEPPAPGDVSTNAPDDLILSADAAAHEDQGVFLQAQNTDAVAEGGLIAPDEAQKATDEEQSESEGMLLYDADGEANAPPPCLDATSASVQEEAERESANFGMSAGQNDQIRGEESIFGIAAELVLTEEVVEEQATASPHVEPPAVASDIVDAPAIAPPLSVNASYELDAVPQSAETDVEHQDWPMQAQTRLWNPSEQLSLVNVASVSRQDTLAIASSDDASSDDAARNASALWSLIEADDLTGAYWLARSLESVNQPCALPASTLAACQGARWLSFSTYKLLADSRDTATEYVPHGEEAHIFIGFAAAMLPAILSPNSIFVGWLNAPIHQAGLCEVVGAVREFAQFNHPLRPEDLAGAQAPAQREAAVRDAARAADAWLSNARKKHFSIRRAREVWEAVLRRGLEELLSPVCGDRRAEAAQVAEQCKKYQRREQVQHLLVSLGRELHHRKEMDIQGDIRAGMIRDVREAADVADRWRALVERQEQGQDNWFADHVAQLCARLQRSAPQALSELNALAREQAGRDVSSAAQCLRRALVYLMQVLDMPNDAGKYQMNAADSIAPAWWLHDEYEREKSLLEALDRRLLWFPEVRIVSPADVPALTPPDALLLRGLLPQRPATAPFLRQAVEGWLEKRDFRFIGLIVRALQNDADAARLKEHCDASLVKTRESLKKEKEQTALIVERALVNGVIAEENHAASAAVVESIQPDRTEQPGKIEDFEPEFARLRRVQQDIAEAERDKTVKLQSLWHDLRPRLEARAPASLWNTICESVEKAFEMHDTRVADEYLAEIRKSLDTGQELELGEASEGDEQFMAASRSALDEFLKSEARITDALHESSRGIKEVEQALRSREVWAGLPFGQISPERLKEAGVALERWQRLKQKRGYEMEDADSLDAVAAVLAYLGFTPLDKLSRPALKIHGGEWAHVTAALSTNNLARPIPGYGSLVQHYDIVLLWNRPGVEAVSARLETMRLTGGGVLVFYMGRLERQHRDRMAQLARSKGFGFAMLDETLLVFLAARRDARLPAFLRCALPFAAPMPYTPDRAGAVPPEMFFGREAMARDLQDADGSCLVYGGRQLGKSALLAHAQRQFHQPENDCYAWVESISAIGNEPLAHLPPETLYDRLRDKFVEHGLIRGTLATTPDGICKQIREAVAPQKPGQKSRRVLVMLDEADNFLEADAKSNFRIVARLRDLMQDTQRKFKVVFAGLHHVQKFQSIPNQPLAHFGTPSLVGPLTFKEAKCLVREPLEALGFRIEDDEVLRILSHTNYHPGLIQKYCQELLRGLFKNGKRDLPTRISKADVESIYREPEVRRFISERFELTLALDNRYRAIAYAIIVEQIKVRDSYAMSYPDYHVLDLVRAWCPQLFEDIDSDQMRILLEEMCGLGVLVHAQNRGYRLRSPNLVRLMGTETNIEHRLLELAAKPAQPADDPESLHPPLDNAWRRYSPLTYAQESALNPRRSGVGIIFASDALGLDQMPHAVRRCVPAEMLQGSSPRALVLEMPARYTGVEEVGEWLRREAEKASDCERVVIYQAIPGGTPGIEKRVRAALQFCKERTGTKKNQNTFIRIFFLMAPGAAWHWVSQPSETLIDLENEADACTWPRLWNEFGIRQRLFQQENMDYSEDTCQAIQQATGGWPWLLERFFEQCNRKNPREFAAQMQQDLSAPGSDLEQDFRRRLGLQPDSPADKLLKQIAFWQPDDKGISFTDLMAVAPDAAGEVTEQKRQEVCEACIEYLCRLGCLSRQERSEQGLTLTVNPFLARMLR